MAEIFQIISFIAISGLLISGTLFYSNNRDLCSQKALWSSTGYPYQYYCPTEDKYLFCWKLSSTQRTCYIANFIESSEIKLRANGKDYVCEGQDLYSKCITENHIEAYYGELA